MSKKYKPVVLLILDGFGISPDKIGSPWEIAEHPTFSEIEKFYPFTALQASGIAVGLPWGKEGNSEVGHLTIGAGKIIYNYLPRISNAINDGSFFINESFLKAVEHIKNNNSALHILGLYSSGTVHAYEEHLYALLDLIKKQNNIQEIYLHLFSDGKDAYNKEGVIYFKKLENLLQTQYPNAKIASVIGRNFAMDRDNNWDKTEKTYNLFVKGEGNKFQSPSSYIESQYQKEIFDQEIEPAYAEASAGKPATESRIKDGDAVIFFNFREDSMRQLVHSFANEKFKNLLIVTMTEYYKDIPASVAFKSANVEHPLAKIISDARLKQLHIAETEKYAHITYFLNGSREEPFENEERILIPSSHAPSYDQVPEMSAKEVTEALISNLGRYDFIAVNFANADMVGHTGNFYATTKALEILDSCVGMIIPKILELNAALLITSDHGNAEEKLYKITGQKKTKHSTNPVPFYIVGNNFRRKNPRTAEEIITGYKDVKGTLTDIAPTILELMDLKKPATMTSQSLLEKLIE
ncbi:2,3-bisphosphoglycerate-independent phosphoglycerate mutase [Patescibacteria group bacterium]|nr:2,3-bisphosphoglycerate-independent phosphoglycerate mutase [Patescibacteria group bacterium]MBU2263554.1 2,3-bisphosphoglycerate-independent phosphoglycerate mutase [Patescibacteria group bacterium]